MATATLTFVKDTNGRQRVGRQIHVTGYLLAGAANDDYAANGLDVTASMFGLSVLESLDIHGLASDGDSATLFEGAYYDAPNGKLQLATSAADGDPLDEGNTTAIGGYKVRCTAKGR